MIKKQKLSSVLCLLVFAGMFPGLMFADCDMMGILARGPNEILAIDPTIGNDFPGLFNEPSDFLVNYFGSTHIPRNTNGYGIAFYRLTGGPGWHHVVDYPPTDDNLYDQVWRSDTNMPYPYDPALIEAIDRIWEQNIPVTDINAYLVLAHARTASGGNDDIPGPHPFTWDYPWTPTPPEGFPYGQNTDEDITYTFEHNGTVSKAKLRQMTEELWESWNPGQTWSNVYPYKTEHIGINELVDSEAYFHWIICNIKLADYKVEEGLRRAVIAMKNWNQYRNFIFSDSYSLYAFKAVANSNDDDYRLIYFQFHDPLLPNFYAVSSAKDGDNINNYGTQLQDRQMVKMYLGGTVSVYNDFNQPLYQKLPYANDFECSSYAVDSRIYLNSWENVLDSRRILIAWEEEADNRFLKMDSRFNGTLAQDEVWFHVDVSEHHGLRMEFQWKYTGIISGGIYLSGDGGQNFESESVYDFNSNDVAPDKWYVVLLDLEDFCISHGIPLSSQFVIKFAGNATNTADSIGIDKISVFSE